MLDLSTRYMGLALSSPIIVGASGLTNTVKNIQACERAGAGAVVLKSIFEEQILAEGDQLSDENAFTHSEAWEYINDYTEENAVSNFLDLISDAKKAVKIPVIASVHCISPGSWVDFIKRMQKAGADAIELNMNVLTGDTRLKGETVEDSHFKLAKSLKSVATIPVSMKISSHFSALSAFLFQLSHSGIQGMTLFNRPYFPDFNIESLALEPARYLSHPQEYLTGLRWISMMSGRLGCEICASTGVHSAESAIKMLLAGASAVQMVSAIYEDGLQAIHGVHSGMRAWMERHHYQRIQDFKGHLCQSESKDPAAFERVQFMRYAAGVE